MATNFRKPSKKTAIIATIAIVALLVVAITGTVVFLKDRGTTEAADLETQQLNRQENANGETANNNQGTVAEPNTENAGTEGTTTENGEVAGNANAGETGTVANNANATTTRTGVTGTATNNGNAATSTIQESTIVENNTIYTENPWETHDVSWEPIGVKAEFALANVNAEEDKIVVDKKADEKVKQGDKVTYQITVENATDKKMNAIEVKDVLDDSIVDVDSIEYLTKQEVNRDGKIVTWTIDIDANSTVEIKFTVKVKTNVAPGKILKNSVVANGVKLKDPTETEIEEAKIDIPVEKEWKNIENDAAKAHEISGIVVKVKGTDKEVTLNKDNSWKDTIKDLTKYDAEGKEIAYELAEEGLTDSDKAILAKYYKIPVINGGKIVNEFDLSKVDDTTEISGIKIWNDNNNQDGKRPTEITITVNQKVGDTITENVANQTIKADKQGNWNYKFTLPKYDKNGAKITYTVNEVSVKDYTTKVEGTTITNTHTPELYNKDGNLKVTKTWNDNNNQDGKRPTSIKVTLNKTVDGTTTAVETVDVTAETNWEHTFTKLPKYEGGKEITYSVSEAEVADYETKIEGATITNTHTPELYNEDGNLKVTKTWNDNNNQDGKRPTSIKVTLNKTVEGTTTAVETVDVTAEKNWEYTFTKLPKYEGGKEITYSVSEAEVADYETNIEGATITNTHTPELYNEDGNLKVTKTWNDNNNQDGKRPATIKVTLSKTVDGTTTVVETVDVTAETNWEHTFTKLPKYEGGKEITYSVSEAEVADYETKVDGFAITNTHTPELYNKDGNLKVTKTWNDNNNQDGKRPETIKVTLSKTVDGKTTVVETVDVTAETNWEHTFTKLPKYEGGKEITYSVSEAEVADYETKVDGFAITNTHTPELYNEDGNLKVTKTWNDNNNQDGKRPTSIKVTLNKTVEGTTTEVETVDVTAETNWEYTFTKLPKYEGGKEITYSVSEAEVKDYETKVDGFAITNTHTPDLYNEDGNLTVTKTWNDNNNQDGKRPTVIKVTLNKTVDGKTTVVETVDVTAETNWEHTFTKLPKYEGGKEITYSVSEAEVKDYETKVDGFAITNTHTPELYNEDGNLKVTKTWNDNNNQDGKRPTVIKVTLNKTVDGKTTAVETVDVTAETNWEHTFTKLPKYEGGKEITYSVSEATVADYETKIEGATITNTHTPDLYNKDGNLKVTKTWNDNNNQDGKRPATIKVTLSKTVDGKTTVVETVDVTAETNWEYTFTKLPKYEGGKEITYSVSEAEVADYETKVDGFAITNTHTPDLYNGDGRLTGTKTWIDNATVKAQKPTSITVKLYADGEPALDKDGEPIIAIATGTEDVWTYEFEGLPKYKNGGTPITYTIKELDANGNPVSEGGNYSEQFVATYEGNNIVNTHVAPEITVTKSNHNEQQTMVKNGETVTYDIIATNDGNAKGEVIITDAVPENSELQGKPTLTIGDVTKNIEMAELMAGYKLELNPNESATISFTVKAKAYAGTEIENTAHYETTDEDKETETVTTPVEAEVDVIPTTTSTVTNPQKVILVLDTSGSMGYGVDGVKGHTPTRISVLKEAAKEFLNNFLPEGTNNQVMIIEYNSNASVKRTYTSSATQANRTVNGLEADGGTNTDAALELANTYISQGETNTSVILMTDGLPTYYQYKDRWGRTQRGGNGKSSQSDEKLKECRDEAIESAELIKDKGAKVYTIGFGLGTNSTAKTFLETVATTEDDYYPSDSSTELNNAFTQITQSIVSDGNRETLTTGIEGTVKGESGVVVIDKKYFDENQNVEIYKQYIGANNPNNVLVENYSWAEFENLTVKETDAEGNEVEVPVVEYVRENGNVTKIKFNLGKYMAATEGISEDDKLTIRFVTPAKQKIRSANAFSLLFSLCDDEEVNDDTVTEYEEQFNKVEQEKASTTSTTPVETDKKETENEKTENNKADNNATDNTETENKNNTVENTETNSGNETTKPEETPSKPEPTTPETDSKVENAVVEPNAE